jgi:hypothetical protein
MRNRGVDAGQQRGVLLGHDGEHPQPSPVHRMAALS